jgi:Protein of unknown function (DUF2946)
MPTVSPRRARLVLWIAAAALLFAALSPTLNALRAKSQPRLFAEICSQMGFLRVAVGDAGAPAEKSVHATSCAWCLQPGTWLALEAPAPTLAAPILVVSLPVAVAVEVPARAPPPHLLAQSRAPPAYS